MRKCLLLPIIIAMLFASHIDAQVSHIPVVDVEGLITNLLNEERASPTNSVNVKERYRKLTNIIRGRLRRNMPINNILPREKGEKINSLIQKGELEKAALLVSEVINGLSKLTTSQRPGSKIDAQVSNRPVDDVERLINNLVNEERSFPTNSVNFKERYRKLINIIRGRLRRNMPINNILPREKGEKINSLIQKGELEKAALLLSEVINGLSKLTASQRPGSKKEDKGSLRQTSKCPSVSENTAKFPPPASYKNSPFGFLDAVVYKGVFLSWNAQMPEQLSDLHVHWVKGGGLQAFIWKRIQLFNADGSYAGFNWDEYDCLVRYLQANNILLLGNVRASEPNADVPKNVRVIANLPKDLKAYQNFIQSLVERYDGDGHDDMPGLRFPVKYWLIEDEPMMPNFWGGTPEEYAVLLKNAFNAVKRADSEAKVIAGALYFDDLNTTSEFAERFFKKLAEISGRDRMYDLLDVHWFFKKGVSSTKLQYKRVKMLRDVLWGLEKKYMGGGGPSPFLVTEIASKYTGKVEHAIDMFKRYIYAISLGAKKVFWTALASSSKKKDIFSKAALISVERGGKENKKPAYFTYKLMVHKLENADFDHIEFIQEAEGVYIFQFIKKGAPLWIAWNDNDKQIEVTLKDIPYNAVKITQVVPRTSQSGGQTIISHFETTTRKVVNGWVGLNLTEIPLIIEDSNVDDMRIINYINYFKEQPLKSRESPSVVPRGYRKGRCGDDVCQSIERKKGVCPEDCS